MLASMTDLLLARFGHGDLDARVSVSVRFEPTASHTQRDGDIVTE